jgi:hypothetical protein
MNIHINAIPSKDEIGQKIASLDMIIAVGFGVAMVTKGGKVIYMEGSTNDNGEWRYLKEFEEMAQNDPDYDWRVLLDAPLKTREYQRQGKNKWVVIDNGPGFA